MDGCSDSVVTIKVEMCVYTISDCFVLQMWWVCHSTCFIEGISVHVLQKFKHHTHMAKSTGLSLPTTQKPQGTLCSYQIHPITLNQTPQSPPPNQHRSHEPTRTTTTNITPPPPPHPPHTHTHRHLHPNTQKPRKQDSRMKSSPQY